MHSIVHPSHMSSDHSHNTANFARLERVAEVYRPISAYACPNTSMWKPSRRSGGYKGRYLWTDAFGVLNFLTLYSLSGEQRYLTFACRLVDAVHSELGYTRDKTSRLPNATAEEPLKGGLRIGKFDESGSDGDGQYFHYLTIWMFALNRFSVATGEESYNNAAISTAQAMLPKFMVDTDNERPRMFWKLSVDLKDVLVDKEGSLDPISGYMTYRLLQSTHGARSNVLLTEIALMKKIVDAKVDDYQTGDALDIGMTLWTAHFLVVGEDWAQRLMQQALISLKHLITTGYFKQPTEARTAYREFGLVLGIKSILTVDTALNKGVLHGESTKEELKELSEQVMQACARNVFGPTKGEMNGRIQDLTPITTIMYGSALVPGI